MKKTKMYLTGILIALGLAISGFGSETIDDNKNTTSIENTVDSAAGTEEFSVTKVPDFDGNAPFVIVNDNKPYFTKKDMSETSFERYSDLDSLGRCGVAFACIGEDIMPKEERGEIGQIKPAGWHTQKYNDIIEGNYVYNRCHLIAFCLAGENANEKKSYYRNQIFKCRWHASF